MTKTEVQEKLMQLPVEDKAEILHALQDDLFGPTELYKWQKELVNEALEDLRKNPDAGVPFAEAMATARTRISQGA